MRVELRTASTNDDLGVIDLPPSNLRRLTEIEYARVTYRVERQETVIRRGQPVTVLWLSRR